MGRAILKFFRAISHIPLRLVKQSTFHGFLHDVERVAILVLLEANTFQTEVSAFLLLFSLTES